LKESIHLVVGPLQLIDEIQASMHDEGVHVTSFLTEASNAITTLLGGAELKLEERLVSGADDTEIVGHCCKVLAAYARSVNCIGCRQYNILANWM